jgi:hypothetical protein
MSDKETMMINVQQSKYDNPRKHRLKLCQKGLETGHTYIESC